MKTEPPKLLALPKRGIPSTRLTSPNPIPKEAILARQEKVFDLRAKGMTHTSIAKELGVSQTTVATDLRQIAKMKYLGLIEKDEVLLAEQDQYIDQMIERWLPLAVSENLNIGETRTNKRGDSYDIVLEAWKASGEATDKMIKLIELKTKLHGLINPVTHKSPEEIGTSVAMGVLAAFQKAWPKQERVIEAEIIEQ